MKHNYWRFLVISLLFFGFRLSAQTFAESEPNDLLASVGVQTISSNGTYTGSYSSFDDEFYKLTPGTSGTLTITWTVAPAANAIEIVENATQVVYILNPNTATFVLNPANSYYIHTWTGFATGNWAFTLSGLISPSGAALNLDGTNDYITTPLNLDNDVMPVTTWEAWIYPTANDATYRQFLSIDDGGWDRFLAINSGNFIVGAGYQWVPTTIDLNQWQHVALIFSGNTVKFYKNGVEYSAPSTHALGMTTANFNIGCRPSPVLEYYSGLIDEVRVWNIERTQCEIQSYMNCEITSTLGGLIANYHFNQGLAGLNNATVTSLTDVSGSAATGTLNNFGLNTFSSNWTVPGGVVSGFTAIASPSAEINVQGNGNSIADGSVLTNTANYTDFATSNTRTFVIQNTGSTLLNVNTPYFTGTNAADFSVTVLPSATVAGSSSTSLVVVFTPTSSGIKTATINIGNNDCDEPVYDFVLQGDGNGSALDFDGGNDYVAFPNNSAPLKLDSNFTVEMWVKPNSLGNQILTYAGYGCIECPSWALTIGSELTCYGTGTPGRLVFSTSDGGNVLAVESNTSPALGVWSHVAVTYNGSDLKMYINGVQQTSLVTFPNYVSVNNTYFVLGADPSPFFGCSLRYPYSGAMDEFRVWKRALCQSEIVNSMNCEIPTNAPGLDVNYHFNQGIANGSNGVVTSLIDATSNAVTGTLNNFGLSGNTSNWIGSSTVSSGLSCTLISVPDIGVKNGTVIIPSGSSTPTVSNNTSFGYTNVGSTISNTFIIYNSGTNSLSITGYSLSGPGASQFSISTAPSAAVPSSGSTAIVITFSPSSVGLKSATLTINSDDCDESPYTFAIEANGTVPGEALNFDGTDDYVTLTHFARPADMTIEAWIKTSASGARQIVGWGGNTSNTAEFKVVGGILSYNEWDNVTFPGVPSTFAINDNAWHHVAVVRTSAPSNNVSIYIDGALNNTGTVNFTISTNALNIGAYNYFGMQQFFDGSLDEVRIWNVARTQCEIQSYMNCEIPTSTVGLLANYHFNQGIAALANPTVTSLTDLSGSANTGTLSNFTLSGLTSNWVNPGAVVSGFSTAVAPNVEINIQGNGNNILDGAVTTSTLNHTNFLSNASRTFVIQNTGLSTLYLGQITITGPDAAAFSITTMPASTIAAAGSSSLVIAFTPTVDGLKTATLNIISNDCDEALYNFMIEGTPPQAEALNFDGAGDAARTNTISNQLYNYTMQAKVNWTGTNGFNQLIIYNGNTGSSGYGMFLPTNTNSVCILVGGINVYTTNCVLTPGIWTSLTFVGKNNNSFVYVNGILSYTFVMATPAAPTASFEVGCNNLGTENFNGSIDEALFWSKSLTQCEILSNLTSEIPGSAPNLLANYHFNQGSAGIANPTVTTVIDASGNNNHLNMVGFALTGTVSNWIAPGAVVSGNTVVTAPNVEINITGNGNPIADGAVATSTLNHTDFGTSFTRTFVIQNTGLAPLYINTPIDMTGANIGEFSITATPPASIAAGGTANLVVAFTPTSLGTKSVNISIPNSDCDEADYDFNVSGVVVPGAAISFDGTDDYIDLGTTATLKNTTAISAETWAYMPSWTGTFVLFGNAQNAGYKMRSNGTDLNALVYRNGSFGTAGYPLTSITPGWHHFAMTFDGRFVRNYLDGVLMATNDAGATYPITYIGNSTLLGVEVGVGSTPYIPSPAYFNGSMDEVRFWNVTRTQCEIQTFMNCEIPSTAAGLVANYHFNQGLAGCTNTLNNLADASGSAITGTLNLFSLFGTSSNWVSPGAIVSGFTTSVAPSVEINVLGNATNITDGDLTPSLADFTDFGANSTRSFVIQNTIGGGTLTIGTPYLTGPNASDFSITTLPVNSLVAVGATTLVITFNPATAGAKTATVNIPNSDCSEALYDFGIIGTPTVGAALNFDGVNDIVDCGTLANLDITAGTWEAWVNISNLALNSRIFFKENVDGGGSGMYESYYLAASGKFQADIKIGATNYSVISTTSPLANTWYHVSVTFDGISLNMHVNGVLEASNASPTGTMNPGTGHLSIGGSFANPISSPMNGSIDEARLWSRALCQSEIAGQMNCELTGTEAGLQVYYKFNQGIAPGINTLVTTVTDIAGANNNGILTSFSLTGIASNWVSPGAVPSGSNCAVFLAPEMDVQGNAVSIPDGALTPTLSNFTDFGAVFSRTFTIYNTGNAALTLITPITLSGANASSFTITTQPTSPVAISGSVNFVVSFIPASLGTKTAQVNITNNDCNESPYNFALSGTPTAAAAMNFDGTNDYINCGNILTASYTKEAWVKIGASANGNNFISNGTGVAGTALWAPGIYNYSLSAGHSGAWNAVQGPTLNFGTWYHVAVTYDSPSQTMILYLNGTAVSTNTNVAPFAGVNPLQIGAYNGTFNMNGSMDEVRIWNRPLCPSEIINNMNCEIPTTANGLLANYHFNQGIASGNNTLITTVTDVSGNGSNGTITNMNSLGVGSNWEAPGAVTSGSACSVINVPEINVVGNGISIQDGDVTPGLADHTSYGSFCFGLNASRTYTIQNTGTSALTVSSITMSGVDASQFSVGALTPASPVTAGGSAVFTVTFTPTSSGVKNATINITNNDCNESPYDYAVTGTCNALPSVTANVSNSVVCNGFTTSLSGAGADTYTWNNSVTNAVPFSPSVTLTYSVIGTNTLTGCTSTNIASQVITVNPIPSVTANISNTVICYGGTVTLTGSGANTYTWSPSAPNATPFTPSISANYSLVGTSSAGCTSTNTTIQNLLVNPLPTLSINSGSICTGQSFTLNPTGATSYTYNPSGPVVNPLVNTTYSVSGSFSTGCISASLAVTEITVYITPTIILNSGAICIGQSFTINPSGANTYTFSSGSAIVSPTNTSSYTVTGTSTDGCINTLPAVNTVTVNPLPIVTANASQTVICNGYSITLNGGGASTYTWTNGLPDNTAFTPSNTATYSVTGTDINGCENNASVSVTVNPLPILSIVSSNSISCDGESITFTASGANTYTWNTNAQTAAITTSLTSTTVFTVTGTDLNQCSNAISYTQTVDPCSGTVDVVETSTNVSCRDKSDAKILLSPVVTYTDHVIYYIWNPSTLCPDSSCAQLNNLKGGPYSVNVKITYTVPHPSGSTPSAALYVKNQQFLKNFDIRDDNPSCTITVLTGITPNNDQVNDVLFIENINLYLNNKVTIFNRWGSKVAEIKGYDNVGKAWPLGGDASTVVSSTYYYIIDPGDGSPILKGWIEVLKN